MESVAQHHSDIPQEGEGGGAVGMGWGVGWGGGGGGWGGVAMGGSVR